VQLREQSYGVVRPIITGSFKRTNELLFVVSLWVDGKQFARVTQGSDDADAFETFDERAAHEALAVLDTAPGSAVVGIMKAIGQCNDLYGLTADAFADEDDDADEGDEDATPGEP
jgi:hypothetical protein